MRLFRRPKQEMKSAAGGLMPPDSRSWWRIIFDSYPGAWQQDVVVDKSTVAAYWAVFSCVSLIAGDIAKMPVNVMQKTKDGIFQPTANRPVLRTPNRFQTRPEFFFNWVVCKLLNGNTYVLKERDNKGFIKALYILDPCRVVPLIAEDGSVYYRLSLDYLSGIIESQITVPASEIIHDRMYPLYHPLIGISPIYACGIAAMQGNAIQNNSANFFKNMSRPGGILTAPGAISQQTADELKTAWSKNFSGANAGKIAVVGDGLDYKPLMINAADSQLIEQLKMTAEMVCACFHVPGHKIGVGAMPTVNNVATLNQQYYDQCLQYPVETMEARLDEGLELAPPYECWFDVKALLRMDPQTRYESHSNAVGGGWYSPNEARMEEDLPPITGGDTPYLQQQNWSLEQLSKRDVNQLNGPAAAPSDAAPPDPSAKEAGFMLRLQDLEKKIADFGQEKAPAMPPDPAAMRRNFITALEKELAA